MKSAFILASLLVGLSQVAHATTLTFDDVPGGSIQDTYGDMPTYQGFDFSGTLDWVDVDGTPSYWGFGTHSGSFAILNNNGGTGVITKHDGSDFTFDGLWAKVWGSAPNSGNSASLSGTIDGYDNGSLVWSISTTLNGSYQFITGHAGAIDELHLGMGHFFLVDDIVLNGQQSAVPEPESYALALAGLGVVGGLLRRRNRV